MFFKGLFHKDGKNKLRRGVSLFLITSVTVAALSFPLPAYSQTEDNNQEPTGDMTENVLGNEIILTIGSKSAKINGTEKLIESAPFIEKETTMVPMRFICEDVLNCNVSFDQATQNVVLNRSDIKCSFNLYGESVTVEMADGTSKDVALTSKPIVKNGVTYMPLRFFAQLFNCNVKYDAATKSIKITDQISQGNDPTLPTLPTTPTEPPKDAPTASVGFLATVAGDTVKYVDSSTDPNGLPIVQKQWMVTINSKVKSGTSIEELMTGAKAGAYEVYYRVKNSAGVWSPWSLSVLTLTINKPPIITTLKAVSATDGASSTIKQGELVDFTYDVDNEQFEEITDTKWSYSWTNKDKLRTMTGKPAAFFSDDTYTVTLSVKDTYGNWSQPYSATVRPGSTIEKSEAQFKFDNLKPGEVFLNNKHINFNDYDAAKPYDIRYEPVSLLASNNPETVTSNAILCTDTLQGNVRLRFHHKNSTPANMRLYAVAHNKNAFPVTLTISNLSTAGPNQDVIQVGCTVVEKYLTNTSGPKTVTLKPGEVYLLNPSSTKLLVGESSAGLIDVNASAPLVFSIASMKESSKYADYHYLPFAEKNSTHIRGTFPNATINLSYTLSGDKPEKIILGREDAFDNYYMAGVDKITNTPLINKGNRGVVHKLTIKAEGKVALIFNPRGSVYRGLIKNIDGNITQLSTSGMMTGITEGATLAILEPGEIRTMTYLAPSGSDTPLLIVAIPFDQLGDF